MSMSASREHHNIAFNSGTWAIETQGVYGAAVYVRGAERLAIAYDGRGRVVRAEHNRQPIAGPDLRAKISDILYSKPAAATPQEKS